MRLIDADRLIDEFEDTVGSPIARTRLKLQVQNQPTVDAVEVVRCKNCDNFQTDWETTFANGRHYCAIMDSIMPSEGFCSYGERKTDETD